MLSKTKLAAFIFLFIISSCRPQTASTKEAGNGDVDWHRFSRLAQHEAFLNGKIHYQGKNDHIKQIRILQLRGARSRWSPDSKSLVFDRQNKDRFFDLYVTDLDGKITLSLTEGVKAIGQKNNGNAVYHPSGEYIVFISEEIDHFGKWSADPGIGLFYNLWAGDKDGRRFWKLTDIPIKKSLFQKVPAMATVNPHFSLDGNVLYWTERYARGGNHNWGRWRVKKADFVVANGSPRLENESVVFEPSRGNYATSMGFIGTNSLLLAGNIDGQHEYGMDQYSYNFKTGVLVNLQGSKKHWEEGAAIAPNGKYIVYMSNKASKYKIDFERKKWFAQLRERDYWLMDANGNNKERLTFFNDPSAPEYLGGRVIVAQSHFSPDGKYLAGTIGIDRGDEKRAHMQLMIVLLEFEPSFRAKLQP